MSMIDPEPAIVLIVEDEAFVRMMGAETLTEEGGYRVICAANADEALAVLEARPDLRLVFTDVDMPGTMNGYGLARLVEVRFPGIKVIVTSGRAMPGRGDLPTGAQFLRKPYTPSALVGMVKDVLEVADAPIMLPQPDDALDEPGSPVLPAGINIGQLDTGIGASGGIAQPLPEPEE
jgi:CheY-like chemotaxis protein